MNGFEEDKQQLIKDLDYVLRFILTIKHKINSSPTENDLMKVVSYHIDTLDVLRRLSLKEDNPNE